MYNLSAYEDQSGEVEQSRKSLADALEAEVVFLCDFVHYESDGIWYFRKIPFQSHLWLEANIQKLFADYEFLQDLKKDTLQKRSEQTQKTSLLLPFL